MGGFFISKSWNNQLMLCILLISCCLSSAKIQNFTAIHNAYPRIRYSAPVVYPLQKYKISQQFTTVCAWEVRADWLFILCKNTKFHSNSQPCLRSTG